MPIILRIIILLLFFVLINSFAQDKEQTNKAIHWECIGPKGTPQGKLSAKGIGRLKFIWTPKHNTDTIYAGSAGGGLWRTINGGKQWKNITPNIPSGVWGMVENPTNSYEKFIITANHINGLNGMNKDYGFGIYHTTDNGKNWTKQNTGIKPKDRIALRRIIAVKDVSDCYYAAGRNEIYRTTDAQNWQCIWKTQNFRLNSIIYSPTDKKHLYLTGKEAFLKISLDGKQTDTLLKTKYRIAAKLNPDKDNQIFLMHNKKNDKGRIKTILKVFDIKKNKLKIKCNSKYNIPAWIKSIEMATDGTEIWAGGVELYGYKENDFERYSSWSNTGSSKYMHADIRDICIRKNKENKNILFIAHDGGLSKRLPNGDIEDISGNLCLSQIYHFSITKEGEIYAGTHDCGMLYMNKDKVWETIRGGDIGTVKIDRNNKNVLFYIQNGSGGKHNLLCRTENGMRFIDNVSNFDAPFCQHPENTDIWLFPKQEGGSTILKKRVNNDNYTEIDKEWGVTTALKICKGNPKIIYYSTMGIWNFDFVHLKRTTDGGKKWERLKLPLLASVSDICIDNKNGNRIWIALGQFHSNKRVFYSENGGYKWINCSEGLPDLPVTAMVLHQKTKTLFAGTEQGIFYKSDKSKKWKIWGENSPKSVISELIFSEDERTLYASTYGQGIWKTDINKKLKINH